MMESASTFATGNSGVGHVSTVATLPTLTHPDLWVLGKGYGAFAARAEGAQ